MNDKQVNRLRSLLFNNSKSIGHVHCFGENGSGRSELVRRIIREQFGDGWVHAMSDFLYAGGSMKLLIDSLRNELGIKSRGDKIEDFLFHVREDYPWDTSFSVRRLIIFLDNAQAIVNFSPATMRCFLNSHKTIEDLQVRFVTCAPSSWDTYQPHLSLGHLPVVQFHFPAPDRDTTVQLITSCNKSLNPNFVRFAVESLFAHCRTPNTLLSVINEAHKSYGNREKFDPSRAGECINKAAAEKIGMCAGARATSSQADDLSDSFQSMPLAMRYLLVASFCASSNAPLADRRFFVKHHGKDKRSERGELMGDLARQLKDAEPKAADWQRIVCIYEILVQAHLEKQLRYFDVKNILSSLCAMGLVSLSSLSSLDMPRVKCLISMESALKVAGSLKITLRDYLEHPN